MTVVDAKIDKSQSCPGSGSRQKEEKICPHDITAPSAPLDVLATLFPRFAVGIPTETQMIPSQGDCSGCIEKGANCHVSFPRRRESTLAIQMDIHHTLPSRRWERV